MKSLTFFSCFLIFFVFPISAQQEMVLIPSGEYSIGKNSDKVLDYSPEHMVFLDAFYIDKFEVSNSDYAEFCEATGHRYPEFWNRDGFNCGEDYPDHPVIGVSFYDAMIYAEWVGKRLPTEAEWEVAARGGLNGMIYPWGNEISPERSNYNKSGYGNTLETGKYEPNGYGIYDVSGNVWEWVSDYYQYDYYLNSAKKNPTGPEKGKFRVIRGGSWHSGPGCTGVLYRNALPPGWVDFAVGFRCVRSKPQSSGNE